MELVDDELTLSVPEDEPELVAVGLAVINLEELAATVAEVEDVAPPVGAPDCDNERTNAPAPIETATSATATTASNLEIP